MTRHSIKRANTLLVILAYSLSATATDYTSNSQADILGVYSRAVQNDAKLSAARHAYQAQLETVPQARSGLLPSLTAGATLEETRLKHSDALASRNRSGSVIRADLSQPLFRAERWYQLQAAKASVAQAGLELAAQEQTLILSTAQAYFEVLRQLDTLAASKAEEVALQHQLEQTQGRMDNGASSITDVLDVQAAYDNARANRQLAQRKVEDAYEALARLTKQPYSSIAGMGHHIPIETPTPNDAQAWVNTATQQNLPLLASYHAVTAAEETILQHKSGHAPTLDVVASYRKGDNDNFGYSNSTELGRTDYQDDIAQGSIGLELNIPLFSGGMTQSKVRESTERLYQTQSEQEDLRREVALKARNYHRAINSDIEQIIARRQNIRSSQKSLEANKVGLEFGSRNIVDVVNAQRQLYSAVRDYNNSRYDYILNTLNLKQAAGTLSPDELVYLSTYLKKDYDPERDFLPPETSEQGHTASQPLGEGR